MGSVVLPLLRPSRFGKTRFVGFVVVWLVLTLMSAVGSISNWFFGGYALAYGLFRVVAELQQSRRVAVIPNLVHQSRRQMLLVLASVITMAGASSGLVSASVGGTMALTAWGLALGFPINDPLVPAWQRNTAAAVFFGTLILLLRYEGLSDLIVRHWIIALVPALALLTHVVGSLLLKETVQTRPFLMPAPPRGVRPIHFATRNASTPSLLRRPNSFRLGGSSTTLRQWIRAAQFESSFGHVGARVWWLNLAFSNALMVVLAAIVTALSLAFGRTADGIAWLGFTEHLRQSVLGDVQGVLVALMWGLTLFVSSGLRYEFLYPLSRQRRSHVSFLGSLGQHASVVSMGLAFVGFVVLLNVPAAVDLLSGSIPGMVRGLLVVSLLAPVFQWQRAVGRRDWLQGDPVERPIKVLLFLGLYLAFAFVWRGIFAGADVSTELSTYGVLLVLSQLMYYFELRQNFRRADLVPTPA